MKAFDRHVLRGWPEDRLPVCAAPTCGRTIDNGDVYAILSGTVKLVCLSCALDPSIRNATLGLMVEQAITHEREARARRARVSAVRTRQDTRIHARSRTVVVKPKKPPGQPKNLKRGHGFRYPPHPCRFCGVVFQPRATRIATPAGLVRGPQPYCSISCSVRDRRPTYLLLVCPACDQRFCPKKGSSARPQVCCSRSCARWWFPRRLRNPNPRPVVWSRAWGDACRRCGRADRRHRGQGYCPGCYRKSRTVGAGRAREPRQTDQRTWADRMRTQAGTDAGGREDHSHGAIAPQPLASVAAISR